MEPVEALEDHILLFDLEVVLADRTHFVLLAEVDLVGFCELIGWEGVQKGSRDGVDYIFVKLEKLLIFF